MLCVCRAFSILLTLVVTTSFGTDVRAQNYDREDCAVISSLDVQLNNGFNVENQDIHVCAETRSEGGICYFTTIQKCCSSHTSLELPLAFQSVMVADETIEVSKFYAGKSDACVHFGSHHYIEPCPTGGQTAQSECQNPVQICSSNSIAGTCDASGCSACQAGYKPPFCCDCIYDEGRGGENYFNDNGYCKQICKENALKGNCNANTGCSMCEDPYQPPDCCNRYVASQSIARPQEEFARAMQAEEDPVIIRCWAGASCTGPTTIVRKTPDNVAACCSGENSKDFKGIFFQIFGEESCSQCPLPEDYCDDSIIPGSCVGNDCTCVKGYTGKNCCNCSSNYYRDGKDCKECPDGSSPDYKQETCICDESDGPKIFVYDKCQAICTDHVANCEQASCECASGYAGSDCCSCAADHVRNGQNCVACPTGTIPDEKQEECVCDQSGGRKVYVDGECKSVCEDYVSLLLSCTATSCPCQRLFAEPDCCTCTNGDVPVDNACPELPRVNCWSTDTCGGDSRTIQTTNPVRDCCLGDSPIGSAYQLLGQEACLSCPDICMEHVAEANCSGLNCQCQTGFSGAGCCECASGYIRDGNSCTACPQGTVPDSEQGKCICDQTDGLKIYVDGQCIPVCENYLNGGRRCSDTSCTCLPYFAEPDCCRCTNGSLPVNNMCPVAPAVRCWQNADCTGNATLLRTFTYVTDCCLGDDPLGKAYQLQGQESCLPCPKICRENFADENCDGLNCQCQDTYAGPGCCDCASGYILVGGGCRTCPVGTVPDSEQLDCVCDQSDGPKIFVNGECISVCFDHVQGECGKSSCQCIPGYVGRNCCICDNGYIRNGNDCTACPSGTIPDSSKTECICDPSQGTAILVDGECKPICADNVDGTCGRTSCQCKTGYTGIDCCNCSSGYVLNGVACSECPAGFVPDSNQGRCICDQTEGIRILVNGECSPICSNNIASGGCNETSCQCLPGYTGRNCCVCDTGYIHNGSTCAPCPDGTIPDAKQEECICDPSQGQRVFVDGECRPYCADNVVEGECGRTSCTCLPGYTGFNCCNCDTDYYHNDDSCSLCPSGTIPSADKTRCICNPALGSNILVDGECIPICSSNIASAGCNETSCQCLPGYTGRNCCVCDTGYIHNGSTCTPCPDGTIPDARQEECICDPSQGQRVFVDGVCKSICTAHVQGTCDSTSCENCGTTSCQCRTGYTGSDCCQCASGYIIDGENCSKCPDGTRPDSDQEHCVCIQSQGLEIFINGECIRVCSNNIVEDSCDRTSCQCKTGFTGSDCCKCDQTQGTKILVNGQCESVCTANVQGQCSQTSCPCRTGYDGDKCCDCASGYIKNGTSCSECPSGTIPISNGTKCICDPENGKQIYDSGKCKPICEKNINQCDETACTCAAGYQPPDCCGCTTGDSPDEEGKCPIPCLDNQDVIFVMDRSTGIGQFELWYSMYAIEILTGALYRGSRNLTISVLSYAVTSTATMLINLTPMLQSDTQVDFDACIEALTMYESRIAMEDTRPRGTYSGKTMDLLQDFIRNNTKTTIITFAGTISDKYSQNLQLIGNSITKIQNKFGESNVKFYSVGFEAENFGGDEGRREEYNSEVYALANGTKDRAVINYIRLESGELLKDVATMLYRNGVFCSVQRDTIFSFGENTAIENNFYDYALCITLDLLILHKGACISKPAYNRACTRVNDTEVEMAEKSLLSMVEGFLRGLTN